MTHWRAVLQTALTPVSGGHTGQLESSDPLAPFPVESPNAGSPCFFLLGFWSERWSGIGASIDCAMGLPQQAPGAGVPRTTRQSSSTRQTGAGGGGCGGFFGLATHWPDSHAATNELTSGARMQRTAAQFGGAQSTMAHFFVSSSPLRMAWGAAAQHEPQHP